MLGFIFKNELLVLTFIHNFTMDFFLIREKWESVLESLSRQDPLMIRATMARIFKTMDSTGVFFVLDRSTSALWEIPWLAWHKSWQSLKADNRLAIMILYIVYIYILDDETILCLRNFLLGFFNKQKALPEKFRAVAIVKACTVLIVIQGFGILCLYVRKCRLKVYLKCLQTNSLTSRWLKFLLELGHLIPWLPLTSWHWNNWKPSAPL